MEAVRPLVRWSFTPQNIDHPSNVRSSATLQIKAHHTMVLLQESRIKKSRCGVVNLALSGGNLWQLDRITGASKSPVWLAHLVRIVLDFEKEGWAVVILETLSPFPFPARSPT